MPAIVTANAPARAKVLLAFAAVYVVWGSTYLAIRYAVATLPPFLLAGARIVVAGAALLAVAWWRERRSEVPPERITWAQWRLATLIGGLLFVGGNGAVVWAETRVASGIAALLVAIMPLWLVLLEWIRPGGTRPTAITAAGLVVGTAGLALLVGVPTDAGSVDPLGAVVLLLGSLTWAAGSLIARSPRLPRSGFRNSGMQMFGGGVLLLVVAAATGELSRFDPAQVSRASLAAWLYLVLFGSLVGFTAFAWLMRNVSAAKVATYAYVNPVVAVLLGWAIASEPVTPRMLVAAAVIVGAVAMITVGRARG